MTDHFDIAVIGRGLMGSACARHLAETGVRTALIGPDEPPDPGACQGPFGSHHDQGRITRHLAHDADWSRLSSRSIARYGALEAESGLNIFTPCGGMISGPETGPGSDVIHHVLDVAKALATPHDRLDAAALPDRFPFFRFAPGHLAAWEADGGYINPRALRDAEGILAARAGAQIIRQAVTGLQSGTLQLADGTTFTAGHVVMATGGYAATNGLLLARPKMRVYARTIVFAEVDETEATRLAHMPSLIFFPQNGTYDLYLLPPIRYPDGKLYIKIGGETDSPRLTDDAQMTAWFHSDGNAEAGAKLLGHLRDLMPDLAIRSTHTGACVVSFTDTGYPYVARLSDHLTLLTGGNGAGAKCCDELGRLGAKTALGDGFASEGYDTDFHAVLA
ncbi:FAD-dependent oxidoreductase [Rhodophyticola sp. CCM32]|uniref:NAD(P)/FAD-dependent oxidoreductase n=1 Tax=Rhodophyticola sp. CCM32 TaxID=2916397 RepID=UPI00107F0CC4|nr:FAD-dependent oxidoreductase [Rhodophyticola sp. CCM32]QBY01589.1 FAD-dependent oxidoreductase [Rhodophyticola sp. CCM32]